jgi:hypothetical protein
MKSLLLSILLVFALTVFAQNDLGRLDDYGRVALAPYIPEQIENMPVIAKNMLANKLAQIVTQAGMSGNAYNERFIITANIVVLTKDLIPAAPPMQAYTLNINLYIGDGVDGKLFSSHSITVKGVGENETKAYISAIKNMKTNDPSYRSFLEEGKTRIIQYYNSRCDFIVREALTLADQNQCEAAIYKLTSVPEVCKDCFDKCMTAVAPIYKKKIDRDCQMLVTQANSIWAANQTVDAANDVADILSQIEPSSACYGQIKPLVSKISARVYQLDKREWKYILREQEQVSERIRAYRAVGVAYGNGQRRYYTYNIHNWW